MGSPEPRVGGASQQPVACGSQGGKPFQISAPPLPTSRPRNTPSPPSPVGSGLVPTSLVTPWWEAGAWSIAAPPPSCSVFCSPSSLKAPEAECLGTRRWDEEKSQGPRDTIPPSVPVGRGFTLYRHPLCLELGASPQLRSGPCLCLLDQELVGCQAFASECVVPEPGTRHLLAPPGFLLCILQLPAPLASNGDAVIGPK